MAENYFDFSNITIPIATLLGVTWLTYKDMGGSAFIIGLFGLGWWGIDQAIKWSRMIEHLKRR